MSTLYIVATPIGNLSDLTIHASEILSSVPVVAAEDTRITKKLLNHIKASPEMVSLNEHTSPKRIETILKKLKVSNMALVTDAGTPGISDPGASLVSSAHKEGHKVTPIPGPSAVVTALSVTGWAFDRFLFIGFPSRKKKEQINILNELINETGPIVMYESPHRLRATLSNINRTFKDRPLVICRELTKIHEEIFIGSASEALNYFENPRGEFVVVIQGVDELVTPDLTDKEIIQTIETLKSDGMRGRALVDRAFKLTGASKRRVYRLSLNK